MTHCKKMTYFLLWILLPLHGFYTSDDLTELKTPTKKSLSLFDKAYKKKVKEVPSYKHVLWWQYISTTGLYSESTADASGTFLPHRFSLWQLAPLQGQDIAVGIFDTEISKTHPLIKCAGTFDTFLNDPPGTNQLPFYDHGTHTAGIIAARIMESKSGVPGIAPRCSLFSFNVLHTSGKPASISALIKAIKKAVECNIQVANISCAFDEFDDPHNVQRKQLEKLLQKIPYVVCASGNKGKKQKKDFEKRISYPARIKNHVISVGAFGSNYHQSSDSFDYFVAPFSQYEKNRGPHFLAPGTHILSCSCYPPSFFNGQASTQDVYAFHSGTSCAAAFMSGFFALVVGEFGTLFSPEHILYVCQQASGSLNDNPEWKEKSLYGVLDMRTALFMLHVLKKCTDKSIKKMSFDLFKKHIKKIKAVLFSESKNIPVLAMPEAFNFVAMKVLEGVT